MTGFAGDGGGVGGGEEGRFLWNDERGWFIEGFCSNVGSKGESAGRGW